MFNLDNINTHQLYSDAGKITIGLAGAKLLTINFSINYKLIKIFLLALLGLIVYHSIIVQYFNSYYILGEKFNTSAPYKTFDDIIKFGLILCIIQIFMGYPLLDTNWLKMIGLILVGLTFYNLVIDKYIYNLLDKINQYGESENEYGYIPSRINYGVASSIIDIVKFGLILILIKIFMNNNYNNIYYTNINYKHIIGFLIGMGIFNYIVNKNTIFINHYM